RHVDEVLAARAEAGRAAEVVDRDRVVAGKREALGQRHVEGVEAAYVGKDEHAGAVSVGRLGDRRGEGRAVGGAQLEHLRAGATGDRWQGEIGEELRQESVKGKAHHSAHQSRTATPSPPSGLWPPIA